MKGELSFIALIQSQTILTLRRGGLNVPRASEIHEMLLNIRELLRILGRVVVELFHWISYSVGISGDCTAIA